MIQVMDTSFGYLNHLLYLHDKDELLPNSNSLDSGPAVANTCHTDPFVLDEYDNNTVSTLDEDKNNKNVRKIENENNERHTQIRKLKKNIQLQMKSWVLTTSEPSLNLSSTESVVHKINTEQTESKTALKTEHKTVQKKMRIKTAHKKTPQVKYKKRTKIYV